MYGLTVNGKWHYTKNNLAKCCIYLKIIKHDIFKSNPTEMCEECLQINNKKCIKSSYNDYDTSIDTGIDVVPMEIENLEIPENKIQTNTLVTMGFVPSPNPIKSFNLWKI